MTAWILENEALLRFALFLGTFVLIATWELAAPRRRLITSKLARWSNNLALSLLNTLLIRLFFPAAAVGFAAWAAQAQLGLLNLLSLPLWLAVLLSVVVLDGVIYWQHRLFHAVPLLWRLHRVHHADLDYDVTTGSRFHPLEMLLSMLIKATAILLLGPPVIAVVLFEILLNVVALFNHGNIRLPRRIDAAIRRLIVTPDMHRVHHSVEPDELNSNFGFNLSLWDHLFGTYTAQPRAGHQQMTIGLKRLRQPSQAIWLPRLLILPFRQKAA